MASPSPTKKKGLKSFFLYNLDSLQEILLFLYIKKY